MKRQRQLAPSQQVRPGQDSAGVRSASSSTSRTATLLTYLPGLDGLRALAVLAVLVYHANYSWLPGGFLGVDVFFVLSGYLITVLLLVEWERHGRIDLRGFWFRRGRRLLPALFVLLIGTLLLAWLFAPDALADSARRHARGPRLLHELVAHFRGPVLLRVDGAAVTAPAPVVARRRGAVLPPVAAAVRSADARCPASTAAGSARGGSRVRVAHGPSLRPRRRPLEAVLRHGHAGFRATHRRCARERLATGREQPLVAHPAVRGGRSPSAWSLVACPRHRRAGCTGRAWLLVPPPR